MMDVDAIRIRAFAPVEHAYDQRDTILYALGLGYGVDPLDPAELRFVFERDLAAVPAMANILAHPGFWAQRPEYGIDWKRLLHAEQMFEIHAPLPPTGTVTGEYRVAGIEDKGVGKGALLHQDKVLRDTATGARLATVRSTLFLRGNGGEGGFGETAAPAEPLPDRAPDRVVNYATLARQALIYRLSGDWNPLHADPEIARQAGFQVPILQGLCTNGIACRAVLAAYAGNDPTRLRRMFTRFTRPVYPGETIRIEFFELAEGLRFRALAVERDEVVLDRCSADIG